jgi:RimJ/RimL family protein N-acetyltransferase
MFLEQNQPAPILETERLSLRRMTEADLDFLAGMLGDQEVMRHYPKPLQRAEAADWLQRVLASYQRNGHGFWLARLRDSGEPVGQVGLLGREIEGQPEVEVAYMLARPFWGRGLATEAALSCRDHALEVLRAPRVVSMIRPENQPSLRVAARLGMVRIGATTHVGLPHDLYAYSRRPLGSRL